MELDYYKLQITGSAWTTKIKHYQYLLKEGLDWMIEDVANIPMSILDLGCGDGWGTEYLRKQLPQKYIKIVGGDIDEYKLKVAEERGVKVEYQDIHNVKGKWDIIFCSHTLEHSYDYKLALKSIIEAIKPGGKLYLIVPIEKEDPRIYNPSHTQWIESCDIIKSEIMRHLDTEIISEELKTRDQLEYWAIIEKHGSN